MSLSRREALNWWTNHVHHYVDEDGNPETALQHKRRFVKVDTGVWDLMLDEGDDDNDVVWATFIKYCSEADPILPEMNEIPLEIEINCEAPPTSEIEAIKADMETATPPELSKIIFEELMPVYEQLEF